jgi:hypothetical protein
MGGLFSSIFKKSDNQNDNDIFDKITNIYIQRHAVSCANTIEKVFGKGQAEKTKHASNSNISYVGVQQCLQVSDFFSKNPIISESNNSIKKPLLIFCCSELIRTHQTLFLSWIRYLKNYQESNGKIIVLPWLNEVAVPKIAGMIINKDNYPESYEKTIASWEKFIDNLYTKFVKIKKDTLNDESTLIQDIENIKEVKNWENLFYLSSEIYENNKNKNKLSNNSKKITIKRKGLQKKMGDMSQFINLFGKILKTYLKEVLEINDEKKLLLKYSGIELVIVAHHNSAEHFMNFIMPSTKAQFKEIQLVNCEVVKLPGKCLKNFIKGIQTQEPMERLFPMNFNNDKSIFNKNLSIIIKGVEVYPLFILYISSLDLFLSVNNIVKTRLKARGIDKRIQIKKPIYLFLKTSIFDYKKQLEKIIKYIKIINEDYNSKNGNTFYNYNKMEDIINQKMVDLNIYMTRRQTINRKFQLKEIKKSSIQNFIMNQMNKQLQINNFNLQKEMENFIERKKKITDFKKDLREYLFGFCELEQTVIDSIAVF